MDIILTQDQNNQDNEDLEKIRKELVKQKHKIKRKQFINSLTNDIIEQALYDAQANRDEVLGLDINEEIEEILSEMKALNWIEILKTRDSKWTIVAELSNTEIRKCIGCMQYNPATDLRIYDHEKDTSYGGHGSGNYCHSCIARFGNERTEKFFDQIISCDKCSDTYQRRQLNEWSKILNKIPVNRTIGYYCKSCAEEVLQSYSKICHMCDISFMASRQDGINLCGDCRAEGYVREWQRVSSHNSRTRVIELPATLTFKQWIKTLNHFEWKCAYSPKHKFQDLEHYLPIELGGGTAANNCVPSCRSCNAKKHDCHPNQLDNLFPSDNLARIRDYLSKQSV